MDFWKRFSLSVVLKLCRLYISLMFFLPNGSCMSMEGIRNFVGLPKEDPL